MAHTHNAECERLHDMLEELIAREDVAPVNALPNGAIAPPPEGTDTAFAAPDTSGPAGADLQLEIANVRQALADMGCDR